MFTIGITKGRWNTLLTALQQFKDDYAKNQPMWRILPEFCQQYPRYERMGLADLCQHVHELYAKYDIARLTTEMYLSDLTPAMKPSDAFAHIAHRKTERVEIDHLEGRITTSLVTPYPPGIPLLIPGEVFNKKIVDYLKFSREFNAQCPGFETDIHGLVEEDRRTARRQDALLTPIACGHERAALRTSSLAQRLDHRHRRLAEAAVDVGDLGGHAGRQVAQQEGRHVADVVDRHVAAQRRRLGHDADRILPKSLMPLAASVLIGPGADAVDAHAAPWGPATRPGSAPTLPAMPWPGPWCCSSARRAWRPGRSASAAPTCRSGRAGPPWPWPGSCRR